MKYWDKDRQGLTSNWSEVGKVWTRFGLTLGKAALQGSAEALRKTAEVLDQFSNVIPDEQGDESDLDQSKNSSQEATETEQTQN